MYDVSKDAEVIVAAISYTYEPNVVAVYRNISGRYMWDQNISAPNVESGFGNSIAINDDATIPVVGAPFDDTKDHDQGEVYVYKLIK